MAALKRLRVRVYDVRFGDAVLVSVPEAQRTRHLLIDVGNVLSGRGGDDAVFEAVVRDVVKRTGGRVDLYVMTHEHLDHVQGLLHADQRVYGGKLREHLRIDHAWLTASAHPEYYDTHPDARRKKSLLLEAYDRVAKHLGAAPGPFAALLATNNPRSTAPCVEFLRGFAEHTHYVHRGADVGGKHPFEEARFEIWAPEEDTSEYYSTLMPSALGLTAGSDGRLTRTAPPLPPPGVDVGAFHDLVESRARGWTDNLLAIDRAANDTSVVLLLEWRGWRLLFAGDAELRSWRRMQREGVLQGPVHFLKVSHHGSHNGTPDEEMLRQLFAPGTGPKTTRRAVISTCRDTYSGIPHDPTNAKLRKLARLRSTTDEPARPWIDTWFRA